jgi:membrane protease YdiL (CAAX protease family)
MRLWHWLGVAVALAIAMFSVLHLFPNEAECVASGRSVDSTRRHCEGSDGYVQLREHVMFHSKEPIIFIVIVGGIVYFVRRRRKRIRESTTTTPHPHSPNGQNRLQ